VPVGALLVGRAGAPLAGAAAETLAEAGLGRPLRRIGLRDTFAKGAADAGYLFAKYGLSAQAIVETIWSALGRPGGAPTTPTGMGNATSGGGRYSPVLPRPVRNKSLGACS
jgi:transketolase